ncbi:hypothetical protein DUNSADRAFT_12740 [Dunaliella salina]|uniref:F-box domain-containing protein n=1 Tax=Dunaliella salina TaxID=3046 RepID=A0ABQ7GAP4_DUNSA|nr:hypothetical protein DUNSADRAFT_12740 [Dunaliella salina]|eukprot:KAF5831686.1 hypothetical protein DUNSADRAFT_12740 [Dunaliella salina]
MHFIDLPDSIHGMVFSHATPETRRALLQTCRALHSSDAFLQQMNTLILVLNEIAHGTVYTQIVRTPPGAAIHKVVVVGDELEGFYEPCVPLQHAFLKLIARPIPSQLRLENITVLEFQDSCYSPTAHAEALADSISIALPNLLHLKGKFPLGSAPFFTGLSGLPLLSLTYDTHELLEDDPVDVDWWGYLRDDLTAVGAITSLQSLTLRCSHVESFACFSTLVHLTKLMWDSDGNPYKDGPGIDQLLSGCQQLQELKAHRLRAHQPPHSQSLRHLHLTACYHDAIPDVADLPHLSTLHIDIVTLWVYMSEGGLLQALDRMRRLGSSNRAFACNIFRIFGRDQLVLAPSLISSLLSLAPTLKESVKELWLLYVQLDAHQLHHLASAFPCATSLSIYDCSLTVASLAAAVTCLQKLSKLSVEHREASNDFLQALQGAWEAAQQKQDGVFWINTYPVYQDANQEPMARAALQRLRAWQDVCNMRAAFNLGSNGHNCLVSIGLFNRHDGAPLGQGENLA